MKLKTGIILGSGLNKFLNEIESPVLQFEDNSGFHKLKIVKGKIGNKEVVIFSGRRHYYEGYSDDKILESVKLAKKLGIELLIITNAAGGLNRTFKVSDLMLITSYLSFLKIKIPVTENSSDNFSDSSKKIKKIAVEEKIALRYGSYCCMTGPSYESGAEIRFLNNMGIDAVGMSTVPEIVYANSLGIKTIAISCITNIVSEQSRHITTHEEVIDAGIKAYPDFSKLLKRIIKDFE